VGYSVVSQKLINKHELGEKTVLCTFDKYHQACADLRQKVMKYCKQEFKQKRYSLVLIDEDGGLYETGYARNIDSGKTRTMYRNISTVWKPYMYEVYGKDEKPAYIIWVE